MDFSKIDYMEVFDAFFSFLTKLMVGLGVLKADEEPPYADYLEDAKLIIEGVKTAMK